MCEIKRRLWDRIERQLIVWGGIVCLAGSSLLAKTIFPDFAVGLGWRAVVVLINDGPESARVTVKIIGAGTNGRFSGLLVNGVAEERSVEIDLSPESMDTLVIDSTFQNLFAQRGFMILESEPAAANIAAVLYYESRQGLEVFESVGVLPVSETASRMASMIPVQVSSTQDTAFAIMPAELIDLEQGTGGPFRYSFSLYDSDGRLVAEQSVVLGGIEADFITEHFTLNSAFQGYLLIRPAEGTTYPLVVAMLVAKRSDGGFELISTPALFSNRPTN
jgi:hypothetical protein